METPILEVADFRVFYGRVEALHGVNLTVASGQIVTVIGPNGAGKTTFLSAIAGLVTTVRGTLRYLGEPRRDWEVEEMVAEGMVLVPESRELFTDMSVEDNLMLGAYIRRSERAGERDALMKEVFRLFPRLEERRRQHAGTLSGGERQMLAIGRALMARPKLLMLDEPSLGLAPRIVKDIFQIIADLRKAGVSILLVEQNARAALNLADFAYVLETGSVSLQGEATRLAADPRVIETYLGLGSSRKKKPAGCALS